MKKDQQQRGTTCAALVLMGISVYVVAQALATPEERTRTPRYPKEGEACSGEPISVSYAYGGGLMGPHECKDQCGSDQERYILYSNGQATQCEPLPGCSDWGEDNGITCKPIMSQ